MGNLLKSIVLIGAGVGDGVGEIDGFGNSELATGCFLIAIPLFQTNLFPDLMQVNFKPEKLEVAPNLLHVAPALIAASDVGNEVRAISNERKIAKRFTALVLQLIHHIHSICTF